MGHTFVRHTDGLLLFSTSDEVLVWSETEKILRIYAWEEVRRLMQPHIDEAARRHEATRRREEAIAALTRKLPPKKKLKAVKERLPTLLAGDVKIHDERILPYIEAMTADDPRFAKCQTLRDYLRAVKDLLQAQSPS